MKKLWIVIFLLVTQYCGFSQVFPEDKLGWKVGVQTYTFKEFSFYEALNKADSCGVRYLECFRNMQIGGGLEGKMDYNMDEAKRIQIKKWLADRKMRLTGYGVVNLKSEEAWRKLFEFGKDMGIETFTAEPEEQFLPFLSNLCDEFEINLAIHNHAYPSHYWYPPVILKAINHALSDRIGACADLGHWVRSGLNPVACLQLLGDKVKWVHMKDMSVYGEEGHSVVWGNGVLNLPEVIETLKRIGFSGQLSAEYEYNWFHNTIDVKQSISFFRSLL
ncbi:MAG TPA: sugar phosphate isomerase/epimerase [Ginsengibacter sp.]|nr:sugar phosphate isomerase/epimerase [Chitinophagaceae bacterium]MCZ2396003.1 sugar phosphate isomerase/epimerase [Chitinophagales bacterium]HRN72160.1 sugar phosphate isomerase/epimerase [Ginsengibacter sp.]HRP45849.1 sugar phosphate isomerase/epimerase [Ginsengibacter sp.]